MARSLHEEGWKNAEHWLVGCDACDGIGWLDVIRAMALAREQIIRW